MNVDRDAFPVMLPTVLKHIANSHFISFDLELSGIPTQRWRKPGTQSLEDRYRELREAAQKYHILQVGITCVEEDIQNQCYYLRPYNFNISPLIYEGLDLERTFSYSTGAVDFLLQHSYEMDAPFKQGVPYMSKTESKVAKERAVAKWDKDAIPDMIIRADDTTTLSFMARIRSEISQWKKTSKPEANFYNIAGNDMPTAEDPHSRLPLSRFEKRLVHQVVRSDFPDLQTFSRPDFVQVQPRNEDEQKSIKNATLKRVERAIFNQTGFRYVADAMAGGDLSDLNLSFCHDQIMDEKPFPHRIEFTKRMSEVKQSLHGRKKMLIGHNCLIDFMYFYQFFYGELPETVEGFQREMKDMFPLIADTKYMATTGPEGGRFRSSQLWQLAESLEKQEKPKFSIPSEHAQFADNERYHEAGFDSYVTAKVFLRLASKLSVMDEPVDSIPGGVQGKQEPAADPPLFENFPISKAEPKAKSRSSRTSKSKFSHQNLFDALQSEAESTEVVAESPVSSSSAVKPSDADRLAERVKLLRLEGDVPAGSQAQLIPRLDGVFWQEYGNKLRVYGTSEGVMDLDKMVERDSAEPGEEETESPASESIWQRVGKALGML